MERWFSSNNDNPYPSRQVKEDLARQSNLTLNQVSIWLKHAREREDSNKKRISTENKLHMLNFINKNKNPNNFDIECLSKETGLNEKKIKAWIRYQNYKQKKI